MHCSTDNISYLGTTTQLWAVNTSERRPRYMEWKRLARLTRWPRDIWVSVLQHLPLLTPGTPNHHSGRSIYIKALSRSKSLNCSKCLVKVYWIKVELYKAVFPGINREKWRSPINKSILAITNNQQKFWILTISGPEFQQLKSKSLEAERRGIVSRCKTTFLWSTESTMTDFLKTYGNWENYSKSIRWIAFITPHLNCLLVNLANEKIKLPFWWIKSILLMFLSNLLQS